MKGTNLADIEAAERHWAECLNFEHLEVLRIYRNKSVAHMSDFPADMQQPVVRQLFDLAAMTANSLRAGERSEAFAILRSPAFFWFRPCHSRWLPSLPRASVSPRSSERHFSLTF
jgi:hypothetical protein